MGSAGLDKGDGPPLPKTPPGQGQDPPGKGAQVAWTWGDPQEEETWGGSEGQDMRDSPPHPRKGGSA